MKKNTTPIVDAIGELNFEGNIIPHSWYQHIRLPVGERERKKDKQCGKSDVVAIILLSDVVYWYRPTIRRDELTGAVVSIEKKFYEDMLQKQYETWGELFGFTKRQTRDAVSRLVKVGLLKREFRSITSKNGTKLNNVMFVEPVIEAIKRITFTHAETHTIIEQLPPYDVQTSHVLRLNVTPTAFDVDTNTEITTKITTENKNSGDFSGKNLGPEKELGDIENEKLTKRPNRVVGVGARKRLKGKNLQAFELVADNLRKTNVSELERWCKNDSERVFAAYRETVKYKALHYKYFATVYDDIPKKMTAQKTKGTIIDYDAVDTALYSNLESDQEGDEL